MATTTHRPGWLLDELASAGRENVDADHVQRYDAKEDADAEKEVALLRQWGLDESSAVLDLGAGTGQFTLAVAPFCASVTAVDVSPVMLDALRAKLVAAKLTNVNVEQAGFLTYERHGEPTDLIYSRYALHHLPDFWKAVALHRARAMLRRGALLRLWDAVYHFAPDETHERIEAWCASVDGQGSDDWHRADVEEHVRDEHSTFTWLLEPMIERAGFTIEEANYSDDGIFARYISRAA